MDDIRLNSIGTIHSCFKEKFGVPRQAGLVKEAPATLIFHPEYARVDAVRELERFSHIWVLFVFHLSVRDTWPEMVRPPRLGGNRKVGVFASRSPFRPNPIGMSAVKLDRIEITDKGPILHLKGVDMVDQTPVLDIKPYLPYSDIIKEATGGFAHEAPIPVFEIRFSPDADMTLNHMGKHNPDLRNIIIQMLGQDPRPAYYENNASDHSKIFGIRIFDHDVKWQVRDHMILVLSLDPVQT
ncbi:MAG: tRNA (N6-threonylcarbamoyladenosine(37)-N6)-methyltransferase TrmO [Proteobacteria bacterium]|nr:tRNA (N6-threonylcarbamoyladenosine(37)-N6)-methyltransferase TrmO [Pseudomonadota bacterium]